MAINSCRLSGLVLEAQKRVFRLAERDHGLTYKAISLDSGLAYNTVRNYAHGEAMMSVISLLKLVGVIPDYLLSHLLAPVERQVVTSQTEMDHDELGANCIRFGGKLQQARSPNSPEGVDIAPCEDAELRACAAQLAVRS